jgi:hypothetical protein
MGRFLAQYRPEMELAKPILYLQQLSWAEAHVIRGSYIFVLLFILFFACHQPSSLPVAQWGNDQLLQYWSIL